MYYQWDLLQHIMGDDNFGDAFTQDMQKIHEIAKSSGRDVGLFDAIPVKLAIEPEGTDGEDLERELQILRGVIETVREMLVINERNRAATAETNRTRPFLRLDALELNLRSFAMHPEVFDAIRELLETGVHVKNLTLPIRTPQQRDVSEAALRLAWSDLMATALGHRVLDSGVMVHLDHLALGELYMAEKFIIPLCSAVRDTRVLRRLSFEGGKMDQLDVASQKRIWKWIDCALFSSPPTNSVDSIKIWFLKARCTAHGELASGTESADPVGDLWRAVTTVRDHSGVISGDCSTVSIAAGSTITVRGVKGRPPTFDTTRPYTGILVRNQPKKPTVDVLVPGIGFCQVSRERITQHEARSTEAFVGVPIKTLELHGSRHDHGGGEHVSLIRAFYERLLRFVAPSLTSLDMDFELLDATDIQTISQLCPKLHSLSLGGFTSESLDAILSLYDAPVNCRISSLDLPHLRVPIQGFEQFLTALTPEDGVHPIQQKLQRLRVGRGYCGIFRRTTQRAFERMLQYNKKLSHFVLFQKTRQNHRGGWFGGAGGDDEDDGDGDRDDVADPNWSLSELYVNGELLPVLPLQFDRQIAFLSVLHPLGEQHRAGASLGTDLIQMIFSFAADHVWRRAFTVRDIESEMLEFMRERHPGLLAGDDD